MTSTLIIDPSLFIWDINHFNGNKPKYYQFISDFMDSIELISDNNYLVFITEGLALLQIDKLPTEIINEELGEPHDFITILYSFLSRILSGCDSTALDRLYEINHEPKVHIYHNEAIIDHEIDLTFIKVNENTDAMTFLTHECFWAHDAKTILLKSDYRDNPLEIVINVQELHALINRTKRIFENSPKHMRGGCGSLLELSSEAAQACLDFAIAIGGNSHALYSFYINNGNKIYLEFRPHHTNRYHGYPIDEKEVPPKIKEILT